MACCKTFFETHKRHDKDCQLARALVNQRTKHIHRVPEVMMPKRTVIAVKQVLRLPVLSPVRYPQPDGSWKYVIQEIA
jgi:hypothetical protein